MCMRHRVLDTSRNTEPRNLRNKKEHYEGKLIDGGQSVDTSQHVNDELITCPLNAGLFIV